MLNILQTPLDAIFSHAQACYPQECCGFLFGNEANHHRTVIDIFICSNAAIAKHKSFLISPEDYMNAEQFADENNLNLLGVYHSHPDCEAMPSKKDVQAALHVFSYLIVSFFNGEVTSIKSWRLQNDSSLKEEAISIVKNNISINKITDGNNYYTHTIT